MVAVLIEKDKEAAEEEEESGVIPLRFEVSYLIYVAPSERSMLRAEEGPLGKQRIN